MPTIIKIKTSVETIRFEDVFFYGNRTVIKTYGQFILEIITKYLQIEGLIQSTETISLGAISSINNITVLTSEGTVAFESWVLLTIGDHNEETLGDLGDLELIDMIRTVN